MCELCDLVAGDIKTQRYYQNSEILIVDCLTCKIPMVVFKQHGEASKEERRRATATINVLFAFKGIRRKPRKIRDHEHWHIIGAQLREEHQ